VSILDIAKKFRDFNFLSITKSAFSVSPINNYRDSLISIREILLSIKIAEIPTIIRLELIRYLVTRDNSRLSSLNPG